MAMQPHRILLCACPAHCAQVLHAAAAQRINLHGLAPQTQWPNETARQTPQRLLWALLPPTAPPTALALEAQWRAHMLQGDHRFSIQMLYGTATQQAQQLAPWLKVQSPAEDANADADCLECLDARSEQTLFQHLLQRT